MIPFAIGTQTHGSVLRPASYCGVTGFKPTYGLISTDGVLPVARSLDTVGFFTHTAAGMRALWEAMGHPLGEFGDFVVGVPEPPLDVEPSMAAAFESTVDVLRSAGCAVRTAAVTRTLATLPLESRIVEHYEGARVHEARYREFADRLNDVAEMVREGMRIPAARYDAALAFIDECRETVMDQLTRTPVMVTPAATGPAPAGLASTGDARMNSPWTALGTPAITIPMPVQAGSLPLGLQLASAVGADGPLLTAAARIAALIDKAGAGGRR
jgi:Asp-tRNA(Asn)/Glu-tRNA(Gln) amidotransferase A subunit family amidase